MKKLEALEHYFGYKEFRPGQAELIEALLEGRDTLGIMPTGAGKSICYQLPALLMPGITLVVSPLISLMKDQVGALVQSGIPAAFLNSSLNMRQYALALSRAREGRYKIIYVAPERLQTPEFLAFASVADISMVTVDEAHCVSQWGQDFRPSYLAIAEFIAALPHRPVVSAFTATATARVKQDIMALLCLQSPHTAVTGFDRRNLYFEVRQPTNKMAELLHILNDRRERFGIVYCATRKSVEEVCENLCARGYAATRYHAGLEDAERHQNQDDFLFDRKTVMVATNAFGMGIDKSNVGYVVHYNMPKNLESYYQEAGRAGRDGEPADCILLYGTNDVRTAQFMISHSREADDTLSPAERQAVLNNEYELLRRMVGYCTTTDCLREYILAYFGETGDAICGNCGNCNTDFAVTDLTAEARAVVGCVQELDSKRRSFGKGMVAKILRGSGEERISSLGLDRLSSYGALRATPGHVVSQLLDKLVDEGALYVSEGEYPTLALTPEAADFFSGGYRLEMKLPKTKRKDKRPAPEGYEDLDMRLFSRLRELRAVLAKRAGVPAYVVFSDATLRDMCAKKPSSMEEMLEVSGVGQAKLERYGEVFLALLVEYAALPQ